VTTLRDVLLAFPNHDSDIISLYGLIDYIQLKQRKFVVVFVPALSIEKGFEKGVLTCVSGVKRLALVAVVVLPPKGSV